MMLDLDAIPDFLYPEQDGHRSCAGCGAIPGRGHAPIGHAPTVPCPVDVIEQLERDRRQTRRQLHAAQEDNERLRRGHEMHEANHLRIVEHAQAELRAAREVVTEAQTQGHGPDTDNPACVQCKAVTAYLKVAGGGS